ncbi:DUF2069 domain-containing protein [Biformimicrobium ophioploci]|uniref:DUF2069 domain-containing protein n=1 Tax=Biformimicrobium ophioploci TaxID=3036711 RepID=A0ABQ6M2N2_9GAMM|nr:DUF2069 domain-containing protein [Microbulbifer sp. NKW57]GMG88549.1 hypothetical protein MNKW57_28700 [Microbulbifer sp. NKW57]
MTFAQKYALAKKINWACYIGLFVLFAIWSFFVDGGSVRLLVIQAVPLLLVLPGLLKESNRSYLWLCFILLIYVTAGIVDFAMPTRQWQHGVLLLLSGVLFVSSMMSARWQRLAQ